MRLKTIQCIPMHHLTGQRNYLHSIIKMMIINMAKMKNIHERTAELVNR